MTEEEIGEMEKQIEEEGPRDPVDAQGNPIQQPEEQVSAEQYPPEDNVSESGGSESLTPELDAAVEKYSGNINKK
jgi:hypothetical protein